MLDDRSSSGWNWWYCAAFRLDFSHVQTTSNFQGVADSQQLCNSTSNICNSWFRSRKPSSFSCHTKRRWTPIQTEHKLSSKYILLNQFPPAALYYRSQITPEMGVWIFRRYHDTQSTQFSTSLTWAYPHINHPPSPQKSSNSPKRKKYKNFAVFTSTLFPSNNAFPPPPHPPNNNDPSPIQRPNKIPLRERRRRRRKQQTLCRWLHLHLQRYPKTRM